jgi:dipeptidase E
VEAVLKLLLTSAGVKNASIHEALLDLLDKPIEESSALAITTASYAMSRGPELAFQYFTGTATTPMCELGWKSVGVLELSVLPSIDREIWIPRVEETDVLLVNGGDPMFLHYWMQRSGLAELLPALNLVYVGLSAGSMIMTPSIGEDFVRWTPPGGGHETLGLVDFSIFPHLDHPALPDNTMASAERWAAKMPHPCYVIDDETAIKVTDGTVEVISEGKWKLLNARP